MKNDSGRADAEGYCVASRPGNARGPKTPGSVETAAGRICLALFTAEVCALLVLLGARRTPAGQTPALLSKAWLAVVGGGFGLLASLGIVLLIVWSCKAPRRRALLLGLSANVITVGLALIASEGLMRALARQDAVGIVVGRVQLVPTWSELTNGSRDVLGRLDSAEASYLSYFVYDPELGWTVGANRRSAGGLYFSSAEGIRSPGPDQRFSREPQRDTVALIGDSNAFSLEVPFRESWGHYLQELLGDGAQVLNFGVDGYGVDQMYLRYKRDVRPWKPKAVVVGFIQHDLVRSLSVYPFVGLGWPGYVVKPRFVIEGGELRLLNAPLSTPLEILGTAGLKELPYLDYDLTIRAEDWRFRSDRTPFVIRLLTSRFRPGVVEPATAQLSGMKDWSSAVELNARLLASLVEAIEEDGATPILVFLPDDDGDNRLAFEAIARASVPLVSPEPCLAEVPAAARRVSSGKHYAGAGNGALARCTAPAVLRALGARERPITGPTRRSSRGETNDRQERARVA
ncbi:MAG TPA: hypothetical protein VFO67_03720 [Gemmatimonadales bacterium]|nr:hypothetical protein [Gemmatimonadales bacterium]